MNNTPGARVTVALLAIRARPALRSAGQCQRKQGHCDVDGGRNIRGVSHVVDAQQIEAGQDAASDRARDIGTIKQPQPGNSARRGFHPARDGGKRRAHQEGGGKQADSRHRAAEDQAR